MSAREQDVLQFLRSGSTPTEDDVRAYLRGDTTLAKPDNGSMAMRAGSGAFGLLKNLARAGAQGASFGFSDEVIGSLRGAVDPDMTMQQGRDAERQALEDMPGALRIPAEIAGGVMSGAGGVRLAGKAGLNAAKLLRSMKGASAVGAGTVGTTAAGSAEGGAGERLRAFAGGVPIGAGLGVAGAAVANRASRVANTIADAKNIRPQAAGDRGVTAKVLGVKSADDEAMDLIQRNLDRDRSPFETLQQRAQQAKGKPVTVLDLAGENTVGLGRVAQSVPGEGKETLKAALEGRGRGQTSRIRSDISRRTGIEREDVFQTADDLVGQMKQKAGPLYEAAYARGVVQDEALSAILQKPSIGRAYARAQQIAAEEGVPLAPLEAPDVRTLDYIKRGLDDLAQVASRSADDKSGLGGNAIRAIRNTRGSLLRRLDELVPEYAQARATFAGDKEVQRALELGRKKFWNADPREVKRMLTDMTESERAMFRRGAVDGVMRNLDRTRSGRNATLPFDNDEMLARLRTLFDDEQSYNALVDDLGLERKMAATERGVLSGSRTAPLAAEMKDAGEDVVGDALIDMATGIPAKSAFRLLTRAAFKGQGGALSGRTADAISRRLAMDPETFLRELQEFAQAEAGRGGAGRAGATAGGAGLISGRQ